VIALLSNLGFDTGSTDSVTEVVIDNFDQWRNSARGDLFASCGGSSGLQLAA